MSDINKSVPPSSLLDGSYYAVIMAGGGGTRLWPMSRRSTPKQLLQLFGDRSLFQIAVQRLEGLFAPDHILVVTIEEQAAALQAQAPEIPLENYLLEPLPRGTASVVGLAAVALRCRDPQATMAVMTADHLIKDIARFQRILTSAYGTAQDGNLVTLGITPTYPATGYGYIQQGEQLSVHTGINVYQALRFHEKPDEPTARQMIASQDHSWNSGMFVWRVDRILDEFAAQMPELNQQLAQISAAWDRPDAADVLHQVWPQIQPETIDFGIMENAETVAVIPAEGLGWHDVGSWEALFEVLPADEDGNVLSGGPHVPLETQNTLILSDNPDRTIVTIGVQDLVIVDTGDAVLICPADQTQKVRQAVNYVKTERPDLS